MTMNYYTFINTVCIECGNCSMTYLDNLGSSFCHLMYEKNRRIFVKRIKPKLVDLAEWPTGHKKETKRFKEIFCSSGICGKKKSRKRKCPELSSCLAEFVDPLKETLLYSSMYEDMNASELESPYYELFGCINPMYDLSRGKKFCANTKHTYAPKKPSVSIIVGGSEEWISLVEEMRG